MGDNVAARIVCESEAPVEAAAGRVLRTTGDATECVLSAFFDNPYRVKPKNTTGELDLTLYITKLLAKSYGKLSYLRPNVSWNVC